MIDQTYSEAGLEADLRQTLKQPVHFPGREKRTPEAGYPKNLQDSVGWPENQTLPSSLRLRLSGTVPPRSA